MKTIFLIGISFVFASCQHPDTVEENLFEYAKRMANVLDLEKVEFNQVSLPPYPELKALQQHIPTTTIKLVDFYGLKHCELYSLVAERNTALGRLQLPSTRYIYERKLLTALQVCISVTTDFKLINKLNAWLEVKSQQLPAVWANLIQLSAEMGHGLATNLNTISGTSSDGINQTKAALNYLVHLSADKPVKSSKLEMSLKQLQDNPLPAKIWRTQLIITNHLNQLTHWLKTQEPQLSCESASESKKVEYLTNVFRLFFIEKIQPLAGKLNHYHYQLTPTSDELINHPDLSADFKEYIRHNHQDGFEGYSSALNEHLAFWQTLFKNCGISPNQI